MTRSPRPVGPQLLLAAVVATAAAPAAARGQPPAKGIDATRYVLDVKDVGRVRGVLTYTVSCPDLQARTWYVFGAVAPELPGQVKVKTVLSPGGVPAADHSPEARSLLVAQIPARDKDSATGVTVRLTYEATLRSRTLRPLTAAPPKVPPLAAADRAAYLADGGLVDFKAAAFKTWLQAQGLVRKPGQPDVAFARQAFLAIRGRLTYEYRDDLDRHATAVCAAGKSDCGGLSALFVAVLRANGVPARSLVGRWAKSAEPGGLLGGLPYYQTHVKAEFYADKVGWVPVDMALGVGDKSAGGLTFFGADRGDFLTAHVDSDLAVEAGPFGRQPVTFVQSPVWWVEGAGSTKSAKSTYGWTVEPVK